MELDKETFSLDGGYENGIEEDKACDLNSNNSKEMMNNKIKDDVMLIGNDNDEGVKSDLLRRSLEKEVLHHECEKWIRRVNELRNTIGEMKGSIGLDPVEAEVTPYKIRIKVDESNSGHTEDDNPTGQFDPSGLCC
ncbi:hypothetical protein F8M41_018577 [Gigaspora margarita]|uniref:Uncharacterized protein n=1 Tax=Gigaspora margarita TaxID=4874 RepID=A0A8H4ELB5_GIGMA|nr:hypothetical protein F8M41_018577 [Gigaspora margarita]